MRKVFTVVDCHSRTAAVMSRATTPAPEATEVSASTESDIPDAQQTKTDTETVEKTPLVTLHVRMVELGIRVASVKSSNPDVAEAEITKNFFTVPDQTVYVYPGRYNVSLLIIREGVTLKMYTNMTDATQGFTDKMESDFKNNKIAVLSGTRILNNKNQAPGAEGCSNFSIIGGVFDENLTDRSTLIFGCAENGKLENFIFKDIKNNHVIQITGTSDMTVNNCIFAGFVCGETFTCEVIQVEPSTPPVSQEDR